MNKFISWVLLHMRFYSFSAPIPVILKRTGEGEGTSAKIRFAEGKNKSRSSELSVL